MYCVTLGELTSYIPEDIFELPKTFTIIITVITILWNEKLREMLEVTQFAVRCGSLQPT